MFLPSVAHFCSFLLLFLSSNVSGPRRCFIVRNIKEFSTMLPQWFRQSQYPSFQRQLNLYGFQRLSAGQDRGAYYHEYFLRGRPHLTHKITRSKVKGSGGRKSSNPEAEPCLYAYPWMPETSTTTELSSLAVSRPGIVPRFAVRPQFMTLSGQPNTSASTPIEHQDLFIPFTTEKPTATLWDDQSFFGFDPFWAAPMQQLQHHDVFEQMLLPSLHSYNNDDASVRFSPIGPVTMTSVGINAMSIYGNSSPPPSIDDARCVPVVPAAAPFGPGIFSFEDSASVSPVRRNTSKPGPTLTFSPPRRTRICEISRAGCSQIQPSGGMKNTDCWVVWGCKFHKKTSRQNFACLP